MLFSCNHYRQQPQGNPKEPANKIVQSRQLRLTGCCLIGDWLRALWVKAAAEEHGDAEAASISLELNLNVVESLRNIGLGKTHDVNA